MASPQHPATMEHLSGDLLSNIFIRLLAKQLAQMRCVSKSWNALLSQSSFVKSHLHRSIHNNNEILLVFDELFHSSKPFTAHSSRSPHRQLTNFIDFPVVFPSEVGTGSLIGSVNGLVCFAYGFHLYIWNPSLSAVLTLPPSAIPHSFESIYRFGFEPKSDDYKLVKLTSLLPTQIIDQPLAELMVVEVYSMRKDSWKLLTQTLPSHVMVLSKQDEVCVDGHDGRLHWLGYNDVERKIQTIITFDLGVETFHEISIPDSIIEYNRNRWNFLGVLVRKLCVMSRIDDGGCEVWVMDEYGVPGSWVKRYVFSQYNGNIIPFGFTLRNEFLFEATFFDQLHLYDPVADKDKSFKARAKMLDVTKIVEYVDSLVWVAPAKRLTSAVATSLICKFEKIHQWDNK